MIGLGPTSPIPRAAMTFSNLYLSLTFLASEIVPGPDISLLTNATVQERYAYDRGTYILFVSICAINGFRATVHQPDPGQGQRCRKNPAAV